MMRQILKVLLPFIFFLHAFDKKKGHNMLALMFDTRCKNMWLVTAFLGLEIVIAIVVNYDQKLLLSLLTKGTKLLMCASVKETKNLQSQGNVEDLFQTTSTNVNT